MLSYSNMTIAKEKVNGYHKMVVFETDNTLLKGNFILTCADKFVFDQELVRLRKSIKDPLVLLKAIAKLFCGLSEEQLLLLISQMELADGAKSMVEQLQRQGYIVGIISNSYQFVVDYVKDILKIDFAIGNRLEFDNGIATGNVTVPAYYFYHLSKKCDHGFCKTNALIYAAKNYGIALHNTIAMGSTEKDLCIIKQAGFGIAFRPKIHELDLAAGQVMDKLTYEIFSSLVQPPNRELI